MRVKVWSGDGKTYLGEGKLVDRETVYFWEDGDGILSIDPPTEPPPEDVIEQMEQKGYTLIEWPSNPKIILDDGTIVYGCQVWWKRA